MNSAVDFEFYKINKLFVLFVVEWLGNKFLSEDKRKSKIMCSLDRSKRVAEC